MTNLIGSFVVATIMVSSGSPASSKGAIPLYDAFNSLCVATNTQPDLIEKAIKVSPFKITQRGSASTAKPIPMSTTLWDMAYEGHKMTLAIGESQEPLGTTMVTNTQNCTITSFSNEDASIDAIRRWVGLPGNSNKSPGVTLYEFQMQGSSRISLEGGDAEKIAKTEGRAWHIAIINGQNMGSVMLTRYLTPRLAR